MCICVALVLVVLLGVWGAFRDVQAARQTALRKEIATIRSHAIRTVGRIERELEQQSGKASLESVREDPWIRQFWQRVIPSEDRRLYAAIVDSEGLVVMHSSPAQDGQTVDYVEFEPVNIEPDDDVFETYSKALAAGRRAFDVRVPIEVSDRTIGYYHTGVDGAWFKHQSARIRRQILQRWSLVISGISIVVVLAAGSLYYIAYRSAAMHNLADMVELQRVTELGQVAAGLAHEIRNPLHALRLNLHSLGRMHGSETSGYQSAEDVSAIISQSNQEIARLDRLVDELLGFARPDDAREEDIDLLAEVQATVGFVSREMKDCDIEVGTDFRTEKAIARMDPSRFRQVLLNLLMNAKESIGAGGHINVQLSSQDEFLQLRVFDDGEGIDEEDRNRIFDPFFTTKEQGSGLGLPLVKRFVEEADGEIRCESVVGGATFCISLPKVVRGKKGKQSNGW